jgi:NAD(P)-dependent dehydrogenase (short-subunit alcohol dehydrogenase family)
MSMNLQNQVALVTGASRGIGKAIALELARQGAKVVGTATTDAGAEAISAYLAEFGGKGVVLNVTDPERCAAVVDEVQKGFGSLSILVNNAGITQVIECAPSKTLIGMAKRIDPVLVGEALVDQAALERVLAAVNG